MSGPTTEAAKRRKRTDAYCSLWGVPAVAFSGRSGIDQGNDVLGSDSPASDVFPVILASDRGVRTAEEIRWRALSLCLVALKGQGLSQHEVFGIADAWDLWDHTTLEENDFILDPAPAEQELLNAAWRFEGVQVLAWAVGLARHLAFADTPVDSGVMTELTLRAIAGSGPGGGAIWAQWPMRSVAELLDGADVARRLDIIARAAIAAGADPVVHPGIAHERNAAFDWLLPAV
jgi:Domain of unknown function (DUF4272)